MPVIDRPGWQTLKKAHGIGTGEAKVNMGKVLEQYEKAFDNRHASPEKHVKLLNQLIKDAAEYRKAIEKKYGTAKKAFLNEFKTRIEDALAQEIKDLESVANPWKNMREEYRELVALSKELGTKARDQKFLADKKAREQLLTALGGITNSIGINLNLLRDEYGKRKDKSDTELKKAITDELKPGISAIAQANETCSKTNCSVDSVRNVLLAVANFGRTLKKHGIA